MDRSVRSGEVVRLGRAASVQFAHPIVVRVIRVHDWSTYDGWVWLDVYELDADGWAVDRRSVFVRADGIQRARPSPFPDLTAPRAKRSARRSDRTSGQPKGGTQSE